MYSIQTRVRYAKAQIDHDAGMPDPAAQSTVMGIGFLAGMVDSDDIG